RYEAISLPENRFFLAELELGLGLWQGSYQQTTGLWLRWYNAAGWVPTRTEQAEQERQWAEQERQRAEQERHRAEQERQRAEQERQWAEQEHQRAEQEHQRAERLAEYLRSQGIDPNNLP
ncbi:MAG: Uma2 family endonuclease, partial [Nostoc sp.]